MSAVFGGVGRIIPVMVDEHVRSMADGAILTREQEARLHSGSTSRQYDDGLAVDEWVEDIGRGIDGLTEGRLRMSDVRRADALTDMIETVVLLQGELSSDGRDDLRRSIDRLLNSLVDSDDWDRTTRRGGRIRALIRRLTVCRLGLESSQRGDADPCGPFHDADVM